MPTFRPKLSQEVKNFTKNKTKKTNSKMLSLPLQKIEKGREK